MDGLSIEMFKPSCVCWAWHWRGAAFERRPQPDPVAQASVVLPNRSLTGGSRERLTA